MHRISIIPSVRRTVQTIGMATFILFTTQCNQSDEAVSIPVPLFTPQLTAHLAATAHNQQSRITTSADGKVSWDANDQLKVFIVPTGTSAWQGNSYRYITDAEDCQNNTFTASPGHKPSLHADKHYDWYVMSPYKEELSSPEGTAATFSFDGQIQDGNNSTAHLTAYDVMTATLLRHPGNKNPKLQLQHKGTLMTFDIVNATAQDVTVDKITFETIPGVYIGGTYTFDFDSEAPLTPLMATHQQTLNLKQPYVLKSGETFTAHTIMPPFILPQGKSFTLGIHTDRGTGQTSTTAKGRDYKFKAGTLNRTTFRITSFTKDGAIFAKGVTKDNGWYDVNKKGDGRTEEGDAAMCWAAASANMLQWWQDRYKEIKGVLPASAVTGKGKKYELAIFELYQQHWDNMHGSEVYYGIPWYFTGENRGANAAYTAQPHPNTGGYWHNEWQNLEPYMGYDYIPYLQYYYGWGPERPEQGRSPLDIVTELIVKGIDEGVVSLSIQAGYSNQHAITLWGYELNEQKKLSKIYITDSDDLISKPNAPRVQLLNEYTIQLKGDEVNMVNSKGTSFTITQICRLKGYK